MSVESENPPYDAKVTVLLPENRLTLHTTLYKTTYFRNTLGSPLNLHLDSKVLKSGHITYYLVQMTYFRNTHGSPLKLHLIGKALKKTRLNPPSEQTCSKHFNRKTRACVRASQTESGHVWRSVRQAVCVVFSSPRASDQGRHVWRHVHQYPLLTEAFQTDRQLGRCMAAVQ